MKGLLNINVQKIILSTSSDLFHKSEMNAMKGGIFWMVLSGSFICLVNGLVAHQKLTDIEMVILSVISWMMSMSIAHLAIYLWITITRIAIHKSNESKN